MKIFKYSVDQIGENTISMAKDAKILSCGSQYEHLFIWALVDENQEVRDRIIEVFPTGLIDNKKRQFIGTVLVVHGAFVWHVFERLE